MHDMGTLRITESEGRDQPKNVDSLKVGVGSQYLWILKNVVSKNDEGRTHTV